MAGDDVRAAGSARDPLEGASTGRWSSPSGSCSRSPTSPRRTAYALVTVVLVDLGDGRTRMDFEQRGGPMTQDQYERAGSGWSGFFDRIDERLAGG